MSNVNKNRENKEEGKHPNKGAGFGKEGTKGPGREGTSHTREAGPADRGGVRKNEGINEREGRESRENEKKQNENRNEKTDNRNKKW